MIAGPSPPLLFIPEAPSGPSPVVPLLLFALVICYLLYRRGATQWIRSTLLRVPDADEDRPGEKD